MTMTMMTMTMTMARRKLFVSIAEPYVTLDHDTLLL